MSAQALPTATATEQRRIRVLVLDDEEIVQWGFKLLVSRQPWARACVAVRDAEHALDLAPRLQPHVALIDTRSLDRDPAVFVRALNGAAPGVRVLLLACTEAMSPSTVRALGAWGYLSRAWSAQDMVTAIRSAALGDHPIVPRRPAATILSARQHEILRMIADGATNTEIATALYLSRHTVKQHTSALYRKLNVRNRTHAVQAARRSGLIGV